MFGDDIKLKFQNYECFAGVFSRDTMPKNVKTPIALIANTDNSTEPGTHWVAFYITSDGIGEYFDSFGLPPLHIEFLEFLYYNSPNGWLYNKITLQCLDCVTCGEYCVAYLLTRLNNANYTDFISLFTSNTYQNDKLIQIYYNILNI